MDILLNFLWKVQPIDIISHSVPEKRLVLDAAAAAAVAVVEPLARTPG